MSIRQALMYYNHNQISVPLIEMGDLTSYESDISELGISTTLVGSINTKGAFGTPPGGTPSPNNKINTSTVPIYPDNVGTTYYINATSQGGGVYLFTANGGTSMGFDNYCGQSVGVQTIGNVFLARASVDGYTRLGFLCINPLQDNYSYSWAFFYQETANGALNKINELLTTSAIPGDKGFRPIGSRTRITIGGGSISGERPTYGSVTIPQPGEPDESSASIIGSGMINVYMVDSGNLERLGQALFSSTWDNWVTNIFRNPMDSLISLQIFPCKPYLGASEPIKMLNHSAIFSDLDVDANANKLAKQFRTFDFGTLSVAEMWESFLDYDATSFQLYLPFIGSVDIPVGEVMGGSVNVQYTVDFLTGMCVANVKCTKTISVSDGGTPFTQESQHAFMGNCSVQVPLTSVSYGNIIGSLAQSASAGLSSGLAGVAGSLAMSAINGGFKPTVETKGTIGANAGFCSVLYPYIVITRPITAEPDSYQEVMGYPSYIESTLGACEDLCVCDNIDLSGLTGATESEMNRIKQLCKEGVYV